ncbi:nudC domain-containing protein 3-like [Halichondria panicea]|uniref:nudC domain-containing protein 3-like n=1 Tax=Halichondria panicea TaxID=6063 RepID=UPI00312B5652
MAAGLPLGNVGGGKYDAALMGILQDCVKLPVFMDTIFSFLARRTDFFIIMEPGDTQAKMGFLERESETMVLSAFKKYELLTRKRETELMREAETKLLETPPSIEPITDELPITLPPPSSSAKSSELVKQVTAAAEKVSDTYNGAEMDNYKWSQTLLDLDIRVPVSKGTKSKDVRVDIKSDRLKVELIRPRRKLLLESRLLHKIKVEDSMWLLDSAKRCLVITLDKTKEIMWKSVFVGEKGIDLTKVDTTRDISEFDVETQAAIQKASYDNHMKMLGKPSSSDKKAHDILRKAWNAEGSPFKGTPFDPSRVQISGNWN